VGLTTLAPPPPRSPAEGRKDGRTDGRSLGRSFHAKPTDFQLSSPTATEASSRHPLTVQQQQLAPPPPTDALAVHPGILASSPRMRERSYSVPTISVFSQQLRCITAIRATILYTGLVGRVRSKFYERGDHVYIWSPPTFATGCHFCTGLDANRRQIYRPISSTKTRQ